MATFIPIRQTKASDEVYGQLKDAILTEKYKAGDKLPSERELIEMFQVSRTVVREAIKILEANQFVEIKQGATGGAFVKHITFERLSDACYDMFMSGQLTLPELCQARFLIEPASIRLSVQNMNEDYKERLLKALDDEKKTSDSNDEMVYYRSQLHYVLAEMTENRFLEAIIKSLAILVREVTKDIQPPFHPDKVHPVGMHDNLVQAVLDKDEDRAAEEMRLHLIDFRNRLEEAEMNFRKTTPGKHLFCGRIDKKTI
ncbi:MAG: FadR/GntR family transcriptional regulator [Deferribacterales bacterium]